MKVLIDMDGVLVDFVSGICKAHGQTNPYDDPKNLGRFEIDEIWGMEPEAFWSKANRQFWENLEPMPEATTLIQFLEATVGAENLCILSTPSKSHESIPGKIKWLEKHFPKLSRRYMFGVGKHFCSNKKHLLIDDKDSNIKAFTSAPEGGKGILYPRPWNTKYEDPFPLGTVMAEFRRLHKIMTRKRVRKIKLPVEMHE